MITCGNRAKHGGTTGQHSSLDGVRACYGFKGETWACTWLIKVPACWSDAMEDVVDERVEECGAVSWHLPGDRGHTCDAGHEHVTDERRAAEGWDYAADEDEAGLLAGRGVRPVAMDGGAIDINPAAMRYAMSL